ncbi:maltase 1-like isoform X2 [Temnothorax longispinosus]|uniref:maltase 1-like isoform X2 n=1 Tax=Temnothorax longispinosus TaxID=300112 RepID=UPI003A9A0A13
MSWTTHLCTLLLFASGSFANHKNNKILNKSWWNNTVFYQVYPRSLYDSDADGIGDLKGIISKLDYIVDTGINAIWLSPIYPSPMIDFGYDISDFKNIDPTFGSLEDFKVLLARAKALGLKVVLDLVPNHTSDKHIWFQKALQGHKKYKNYYVWARGRNGDGITPPNNWISVFSDSAWTYVESQKQWYLHQFEYRQPDLNFRNPAVRLEMKKVLIFWLDLGIDGFRIDSSAFIYEDLKLRDEPRSFVEGATPRDYTYLNHIYTLDLIETYKLFGEWRKFVDLYAAKHNQDQKLGNHDNPRIASRFPDRSDQMTMLSMILPGLAVTYNGDEIGMVDKRDISWEDTKDPQACLAGQAQYLSVTRDPERTPFQWDATKNAGFSTAKSTWLPVNQNYKQLNLAKQMEAKESHYKIYKTLALLHRTEPALTEGSYKSITTNNDIVLGVIRNNGYRIVVLLINFSDDESQVVDLSQEGLPSNLKVQVASLGSNMKAGKLIDVKTISLPAKAAVVYITV